MKVAIVAIAKLENNYIKEWTEYHKNIGIDKIFLIDNNEINGEKFEDVINDFIASGFVEIIDKRGIHPTEDTNIQARFTREGYLSASKQYDWIAVIDIDEYIAFSAFNNIKDYLSQEKFNNFDAIRLNWKIYNDNNLIKVENNDYSLVKRFTTWLPHKMGKSIYKSNLSSEKVKAMTGHGSPLCINCDEDGNLLENNERISIVNTNPLYNTAWINHYKTKTLEEFVSQRLARQAINIRTRQYDLSLYFKFCEKTPEKEKFGKELLEKYKIADLKK